jgi:dTDP-4-amino-4,6-dideoxygalactose transaminase
MIEKKAMNKDRFKRAWSYANSARDAWSEIIEKYKVTHPFGKILLPAYIGWSVNEGSGIFDSVLKSGMEFEFYGLGMRLEIDFDDLKSKVEANNESLVLLVHYFGFVDNDYNKIATWLEDNDIFFVEDCAHAWLTDMIGGVCGRRGKFAFYSLHKLLPVEIGGIMVDNAPIGNCNDAINPFYDLSYDLYTIYNLRRTNYNYLLQLLIDVKGIEVIFKNLNEGICPQTLPVILESKDRNTLYTEMNEAGFGMVSLYHTMISDLDNTKSEAAQKLAPRIINFPIHQDVELNHIDAMVHEFKRILNA